MAGNVKLMTSAGGGVILDTAATTATDVTVKVPAVNGTFNMSGAVNEVPAGSASAPAIYSTGNTNTGVFFPAADTVGVTTGGAERMRLDSSGRLLLGCTSTPSSTVGGVLIGNQSSAEALISSTGSYTGGSDRCLFINGNGLVGKIAVSGSTTTYNTSSDYRLKENIQPMQNALGVVAQLNPVTYTWKADASDGQGFIAHELQAIVPDCVTGEKDAVDAEGNPVYQGVDTSFLVATLTKAIQELSAKNDALEARIAALEAK